MIQEYDKKRMVFLLAAPSPSPERILPGSDFKTGVFDVYYL